MKSFIVTGLLTALALASRAVCQDATMPVPPAPAKEHAVLGNFVGEWDSASEASMGPGQAAMKCTGTMTGRMLGSYWVVNESTGEGMGVKVEALQTIGFDLEKKKFVGTWVDSMWNHLWRYEGTYDEAAKTLSLEADGPNFMGGGGTAKFRDSYTFKSADEIAVSSAMQGENGEWTTFMTGTMTRKK